MAFINFLTEPCDYCGKRRVVDIFQRTWLLCRECFGKVKSVRTSYGSKLVRK